MHIWRHVGIYRHIQTDKETCMHIQTSRETEKDWEAHRAKHTGAHRDIQAYKLTDKQSWQADSQTD